MECELAEAGIAGGAVNCILATTGAVPSRNVVSGRSTCGNTRINANRNNSEMSKVQRQGVMAIRSKQALYVNLDFRACQ